jgi:hypothetical protein
MASEKRKLALSKETLRTLSATALSQVAGGACYASQYCAATALEGCGSGRTYDYYNNYICGPSECQTLVVCYGGGGTSTTAFTGCSTNQYPTVSNVCGGNPTYACVTNSYC